MNRLLVCLVFVELAVGNTGFEFKTSQVIDLDDLLISDEVIILCPGTGCIIYTTQLDGPSVGVFKGDQLLTTTDKIFKKKDGLLVGYHLPASTEYRLRRTLPIVSSQILYIVQDSAGPGAVTTFDHDSWEDLDIKPNGSRLVTVLSGVQGGITFSQYKGVYRPQIYSVGFDSVAACKPIYSATSVRNAEVSEISIPSPIATVDFVTIDPSNGYHARKSGSAEVMVGQSVVAMSPGYTGCPDLDRYMESSLDISKFLVKERTGVSANFHDVSLQKGSLSLIAGDTNIAIVGEQPYESFIVVESYDYLELRWAPKHDNFSGRQFFAAQIDFVSNGASPTLTMLSALVITLALL